MSDDQEDQDAEEQELLFQFHRAHDLLSILDAEGADDPDITAFLNDPRVKRFLKSC